MAKKTIKIRAKLKGDTVVVKALMTHPMETGARKDKNGEPIPAHFIQEVTCTSGDHTLMSAQWSGGVSKNPYLSFRYQGGKKGDTLTLSWLDNTGKSDAVEAKVG